ncbi:Phage major tail protein 2 [Pseudovibrio sp. W64]|uniref:phage major tail protein, TP901-1 family n=1 Tax=unclassified Pseudovibrio TaxID=2627060 RepID=UPI0007AE6707|nr:MULTISPECIES: phage major tail protein, TP901-1 family [unclassified Pseudovibrio]KZK76483.1 Phage major tail protein 2 [Pseudovibrio sp. W64]KZL02963.1 Phage major tail protein 2 [Pseudovibrio sp. W74]KZL07666.1 Phage major tail protein 2 [Pseudovibrio sp. Ad14]
MADGKGRLLLLKLGNGADPEVFENTAGIKTRNLSINNSLVDATVPDSDDPGSIVYSSSVHGIQSVSFSGSGLSDDSATSTQLNAACLEQTRTNAKVIVPGLGEYAGVILIESIEFSGEVEGEAEFSISVKFTGKVTFTAE